MGEEIITYIVSAYHLSAESSYVFGPIKGEEAVDKFCEQLSENYGEPYVQVLNEPWLVNTGMELS